MTLRTPHRTLGAQPGADMGHATVRLQDLVTRLRTVTEKGLERHFAAALFRVYAWGLQPVSPETR